jgi:ankyrin repeat protein
MDDDALSVAISCADDLTCDLNQGGHAGRTPLHLAVLNSKLSMIDFLLENESVANVQDDDGNTPLYLATTFPVVKLLLTKGKANPNIPNNEGWCSIHNAARRFDANSCRYLLKYNANVNVADHDRWLTPLHVMMISLAETEQEDISSDVYETAKVLVGDSTIELNEGDKDGNTPLHLLSTLAFDGMDDLINLLLEHGADPQVRNHLGQTSIYLLLHNRQLSTFKFFPDLVLGLMTKVV